MVSDYHPYRHLDFGPAPSVATGTVTWTAPVRAAAAFDEAVECPGREYHEESGRVFCYLLQIGRHRWARVIRYRIGRLQMKLATCYHLSDRWGLGLDLPS